MPLLCSIKHKLKPYKTVTTEHYRFVYSRCQRCGIARAHAVPHENPFELTTEVIDQRTGKPWPRHRA